MTHRRSISLLFFTLVVVMLGFGMVIPILPFYIEKLGASGSSLGLLMAAYAGMQLIFSPIWGAASDRMGRKPLLLLGVLGNAITQVLFGLSTQLWMLFASRMLAGILSSATLPTAMAYIGDTTTEDERGSGMGVMGAAMGVGMVLGPGIAGWLATFSLSLPFFVAAGLSVLAMVFIFILLPESLPEQARLASEDRKQTGQLRSMWEALFGPIGFLLFLAFLLSFGLTSFEAVFGLFALQRYGYGPQSVGGILTLIGLIAAIMQGALTGVLSRRFGEPRIILVSLLGTSVGFVLMLSAQETMTVLLTVCFFVVSHALLRPSLSSLISKRSQGGQGVAMGLNNAFMSLGRIAGPIWAGALFDVNANLPYLSGSGVMAVGFLASLIWGWRNRKANQPDPVTTFVPPSKPLLGTDDLGGME